MTSFPHIFALTTWGPLTFDNNGMGPYVNGVDTYIVGRGVGSPENLKVQVLKSSDITDPTSFSLVSLADNPKGGGGGLVNIATVQVGTKIHVVFYQGASPEVGEEVFYCRFDMDLDLWDEIDTTQIEVLVEANDSDNFPISIAVRSDGDIVVTFSGDPEKVHGTNFDRIFYSVSSDGGQTWASSVSIQDGGEINRSGGLIAYNIQTDDCHIIMNEDGDIFQRTLNSSDALQTYTDTGFSCPIVNGQAGAAPFSSGLVVERGTESHARVLHVTPGPPSKRPSILEFDSVPDPVGYSQTILEELESDDTFSKYVAALGVFSNGQLIAVWSRVEAGGNEGMIWTTDDGDTGAGDTWETPRLVTSLQEEWVSGRIINREDGDGEKFAICWGTGTIFNYMEIEPNDFSPNTLDELGQPIEGYNLSPVIV